jgi:glucuronate isomerase
MTNPLSNTLASRITEQLSQIVLVDPHSHINPLSATAVNLADLLGYHYYTELAHSSGLAKEQIEQPGISPKEKVARLMTTMRPINNTVQWSWMVDLCQNLFGWDEPTIDLKNWERLYDLVDSKCNAQGWEDAVLEKSRVESIFLTNDFDDPLEGFDLKRYIPCLRTDDLVFHFAKPEVRRRLEICTKLMITNLTSLKAAITNRFEHFKSKGVKACAISLPPSFAPIKVSDNAASQALEDILKNGVSAATASLESLSRWIFWNLADHCNEYKLPFDLMIGVNRQVYPTGVYQGQDLYDSRVSLIQYAPLLNAFPKVTFPISVLASVTNQELVDYAWIFPNVVTNGHWWYSNTPSIIAHDLRARLEAIPRTKQIGYYSDAYKIEFILPKFNMYRSILGRVLADEFVNNRGWTEDECVELGTEVLRGNVERIFV